MKILPLLIVLAGCATPSVRDVNVVDPTMSCLIEGKVFGILRFDSKDAIVGQVYFTVRLRPAPVPDAIS